MRVRLRASEVGQIREKRAIPHISAGREYLVVGYDDEYYRLVNDQGEPVLYPKDRFEIVSARIPACWVRRDQGDGEYHVDAPECSAPGFYEDWFDHVPEAKRAFEDVRRRLESDDPCVDTT